MSNSYLTQPLKLDTDLVNYKITSTAKLGIRPYKIVIEAGVSTSAGTITVTDPLNSTVNYYPPVIIASGQAAGTILYTDSPSIPIVWQNFSVTGLTATGAVMYIWYRI